VSERPKQKLLIVEDDPGLQRQLAWVFPQHEILLASTREEVLTELRRHEPPVVLQDIGLRPDPAGASDGFDTLSEILALAPRTKVIVVTASGDRANAVRAIALGAHDFYQKPVDAEVLRLIVNRAFRMAELEDENRHLTAQHSSAALDGILATSDVMLRVCRQIEKVAATSATVLLLGESGTGKEVLARALHKLSGRSQGPFVAINCAAIPETLLESELFGYEKGAFTGAHKQTIGKIEYASSGTLFLDEIGDMPLALQPKILRFLQERVIERLGGRETVPVDVRVISATNRDLAASITGQTFRQDLFYRINEVTVPIPPLRARSGDAAVIAQYLLEDRARRHERDVRGFTPEAIRAIETYEWPGNIRELENKVNGAVIMADGPQLTAADLGLKTNGHDLEFLNLRAARQQAERNAINRALVITHGNLSRAAALLGVTRPTLYDLMAKNDLKPQGRGAVVYEADTQ
jgi:two-component system NtrC family response regulator